MLGSAVRMARDYNRGLLLPVRWAHVLGAGLSGIIGPFIRWTRDPSRRYWAWPALVAGVLFLLIHPFDTLLSDFLRWLPIEGDGAREIEAWQQYGAGGSLLFTGMVIWLLDPPRRRRLLDLVAAAVLVSVSCSVLKVLAGRARPAYGDSSLFLGPWGMHPVRSTGPEFAPDEPWRLVSSLHASELWAMPSSHTAAAVVLSVFLAVLYPRLRTLTIVMVAIVGLARLKLGAHWPTDVAVGAVLGYAIAAPAVRNFWGVRALDWFWLMFVDRTAAPIWPGIVLKESMRPSP